MNGWFIPGRLDFFIDPLVISAVGLLRARAGRRLGHHLEQPAAERSGGMLAQRRYHV